MTPVTRRVSDAQKNRLIFLLRFPPHRIPPRHPIHWIMGVLQQIGTHLRSQRIRLLHPPILARLIAFRIPRHPASLFLLFLFLFLPLGRFSSVTRLIILNRELSRLPKRNHPLRPNILRF